MSLYNGIDPIGFVSSGLYTETYPATGAGVNSLFASFGLIENAPEPSVGDEKLVKIIGSAFKKLIE